MKMPAVVNQTVNDAQWALSGFGRIKYVDHKGRDAGMILPRNWTVCQQQPAPGTRITDGVTLTVLKRGQKCPVNH